MAIEYPAQVLAEKPLNAAPTTLRKSFFERLLARVIPQDVLNQNNPALDGLRAMAALMVLAYHLIKYVAKQSTNDPNINGAFSTALFNAGDYWDVGAKGVPLFFVLSAFLLFQPYSRAMLKPNKKFPATKKFLKRRLLRIYPAYLFNLVLVVLIFTPQMLNPANWYILWWHLFTLFDLSSTTIGVINPSYWSLAVETRFYLLIPFIALIIGGILAKKGLKYALGFTGIFIVAPFYTLTIIIVCLNQTEQVDAINLFNLVKFLPVFFAGLACSLVYSYLTETTTGKLKYEKYRQEFNRYGILSLAGLIIVPALMASGFINWIFYRIVEQSFLGICFSGILLATLLGGKTWARIFGHPVLRFIGIISYSLYLWHENLFIYVIVPVARSFKQEALVLPVSLLLTLVITLPISYISYMLVERLFFRVRKPSVPGSIEPEIKVSQAEQLVETRS